MNKSTNQITKGKETKRQTAGERDTELRGEKQKVLSYPETTAEEQDGFRKELTLCMPYNLRWAREECGVFWQSPLGWLGKIEGVGGWQWG